MSRAFLLVLTLIALGSISEMAAALGDPVDLATLESLRGGILYHCATPLEDGRECDVCEPDGQDNYTQCFTQTQGDVCPFNYEDPSMPSPTCTLDEQQCGGLKGGYYDSECDTWIPGSSGNCTRRYFEGTTGSASVNCDLGG